MSVTGEKLQPTLFERGRPGRGGGKIPHPPKDALDRLPADARRETPPALPEMNEPDVVRHYVNLSQLNHAVDTGFYPLGSCTMKFNPKLNEWAARLPGFAELHPMAPDEVAQGTLQLLWELEAALAEISGMRAVSLQPAAGAQGEFTGILMIRAYHQARGESERTEVLVPDSSHGTNPATASMAGFTTITIPSADDGGVDVDAFEAALGPRTAAVMITNPSTLGLFERRIGDLLGRVHEAGALAYMDGANLNAILGRFKPGQAGFDVMHFNVHKTFSTPHGGGGPGAGPVGVGERLLPYLPTPRVLRLDDGTFRLERPDERTTSIGRELPQVTSRRDVRPAVRPPVQARVRGVRREPEGAHRRAHVGRRKAAHRLRLPPADDLLPADRGRGDAHRTDRDRVGRDARRVRRRARRDRRRSRARPRHGQDRSAYGAREAARRGDGRTPAEPALATDGRCGDALSGLSGNGTSAVLTGTPFV
jgi:glycine dehydrogenase subunit 2